MDAAEARLTKLAASYEQAAAHHRSNAEGSEAVKYLMRVAIQRTAVASEPIRSAAGLEIAITSTMSVLKDYLSPNAQKAFIEYIIDRHPAEVAEYAPGDPFFQATLEVFGAQALFDHITRKGAAELKQQENYDTDEPAPSS